MNKKSELLSPAGTLKNMRYAFAYGADAVYAGQPRYSLRVRNNEFTLDNLEIGIKEAHALGKKFYVVSNIAPHNAKLKTFIKDITPIIALNPDALIMSDPGLIMMVKTHFPHQDIHLSVQSNVINWASVKFWHEQGIKRIILSRELSLTEIEEIKIKCPEMELEVFVHGALCMAYSGRCLLSGYMNKRDSNQGACTNACRWEYNVHEAKEDMNGDVTLVEPKKEMNMVLLEEKHRPGEYMPTYEDEHGTYIMNSKDLRAVQHVEQLYQMGIDSLKIEGRTKSFYYVARTAQIYRKAIDDAALGKPFDNNLLYHLESLASRGYTEGFLRRHTHDHYQNYDYGYSVSEKQQFVGEISGQKNDAGLIEVFVKNKFSVGDRLELMTPKGNMSFELQCLVDKKDQNIEVAKGNGHTVYLNIDTDLDLDYGILLRYLNLDQNTRNPF